MDLNPGQIYYRNNKETWSAVYYQRRLAKLKADPQLVIAKNEANRLHMQNKRPAKAELSMINKLAAILMFGGKCEMCGWEGHPAGFEFDHKNPATKKFKIASLCQRVDLGPLVEELKKCQLLCGTCHNIKSWEEGDVRKGRPRKEALHD